MLNEKNSTWRLFSSPVLLVLGFLCSGYQTHGQISAPVAGQASNVTSESFTANWSSVSGSFVTYLLDVSESSLFTTFVGVYNGYNVGPNTSRTITGLQGSKTYYYRVRATSSGTTSGYSNTISLTTEAPVPATPMATNATSVTSSSFTANWLTSGGATSYQLQVAVDAAFASIVADLSQTTTSRSVTGLTGATTYYYRVRAINSTGSSPYSNTISVLLKPAAPVAIAATGASSTSFIANWNTSPGASSYALDVSSDNFATTLSGYTGKIVSGTNALVTGLSPNTTYAYRLRASNDAGSSANSNVITVTLTVDIPVATSGTNVGSVSFTANWNSVNGATGYEVDLSTSSSFSPLIFDGVSASGTSRMFSSLSPGTVYWYRVRAVGSSGVSGNSNAVSVLLLPPVPVSTDATAITAYSFTANWSSAQGATSYKLDVARDNGFNDVLAGYSDLNVAANSYSVTGLSPGNIYYYRVRASNASGTTSVSSNVTSVLLLPPAPIAESASNVTFNSFVATWGESLSATEYRLDVSTNASFTSFVTGYSNRVVSSTTHIVTGLTGGSTYYFRVRAVNGSGSSVNSNIVDVPFPPGAPQVVISNLTDNSFRISWNSDPNADSYLLDVALNSGFTTASLLRSNLTLSTLLYNLSDLSAGLTYYVRMRAVNNVGPSGYSATLNVLTLPGPIVATPATSITTSSFTANWNASTSSSVSIYRIDVSTDRNFVSFVPNYQNRLVSGTSITIGGLTLNKNYYYRVRAENASGVSANSNTITVDRDKNYIKVTDSRVAGLTTIEATEMATIDDQNTSYEFFDGLGRTIQRVSMQASPLLNDIVKPFEYDAFGREVKIYSPYVDENTGWFKYNSLQDPNTTLNSQPSIYETGEQYKFYQSADKIAQDPMPYAERQLELSPLNRPIKEYGPGHAWSSASQDKFVEHGYRVNKFGTASGLERVIAWKLDGSGALSRETAYPGFVESGGYFSPGQLQIKSTIDEQGHEVREYTDKEGRVILKKVQAVENASLNNDSHWAQTYYIYDDFGNLVMVLPPEAVKALIGQ